MTDSLILANAIELIGAVGGTPSADPRCPGASFRLQPGYDLGGPAPTTDTVASLLLDGERPFGYRASNRTITLPVLITAPDFYTLAAAREVLLSAINQQTWTMRWTRDTAGPYAGNTSPMPLLFDCFRAQASVIRWGGPDQYNLHPYGQLTLTFQALPYARSDLPVIVDFPSPLSGLAPPPDPVLIDDFTSVTAAGWTQATAGPSGSSAWWPPPSAHPDGTGVRPSYTAAGLSLDLTGLAAVTMWAGFSSTHFFGAWCRAGGPVRFTFTLTDSSANTLSFAKSIVVKGSDQAASPRWTKVRVPFPTLTVDALAFNFAAVTGYTVQATNMGGGDLRYTNFYIDDLYAVPPPVEQDLAPVRGAVYDLAGIVGTARGPASWQFQVPSAGGGNLVSTTQVFTTTGNFQWTAPYGVTTVAVECTGGGGAGADGPVGGSGAGGGGGEAAYNPAVAVTPGNVYSFTVSGGTGVGGSGAGVSRFTGDSVTVTAHGGTSGTGSVGGFGGTGSAAPVHHDGGDGGIAYTGGGGGGGGGGAGTGGAGGTGGDGGATAGGIAGTGGTGGTPGWTGGRGGKGLSKTGSGHAEHGIWPGGGGGGGSPNGNAGPGGNGQVTLTYLYPQTSATLLVHRPSPDAPDTLCPFVSPGPDDTPDGTSQYPIPSLIPSLNARFAGTYTVILVANAWDSPATPRTLTVTVTQWEQPGGGASYTTSASATVTPSGMPSQMAILGEVTLPVNALAPDNFAAYFTAAITSTDTADTFQDVLFLDTMGSTVIIQSPTGYANYYLDEPTVDQDLGLIMGSVFDRSAAVSLLDRAIVSGPGIGVDPDNNQQLLVYSTGGAPSVELTYWPRWWNDRFA